MESSKCFYVIRTVAYPSSKSCVFWTLYTVNTQHHYKDKVRLFHLYFWSPVSGCSYGVCGPKGCYAQNCLGYYSYDNDYTLLHVGCLYTIVLRYIMFISKTTIGIHLLQWNNNNPGELLIAAVQGNIIVHA